MNSQQQTPVRGMRDLIGIDGAKYNFIVQTLSQLALRYGYQFLETPILENTEIFARGIGEETDIVGKEMFTFLDKSNNSLSLRPEGTAAAVRALISNKLTQSLPQQWFYHGPMFRYDRPQKGRYRQFYQFGLEHFGSNSPVDDAEVIALCYNCLQKLGVQNATLQLNSVGDHASRQNYKQALVQYLKPFEAQLSPDSQRRLQKNPLRILDSKDEMDKKICQNAPQISNYLNESSSQFFEKVKTALQRLKIPFVIDPSLVRGLDYYDHTTFEFEITIPETQDHLAVGGGGRYNGLIQELGGPDIPAVGFAFGIDRLMLVVQDFSHSHLKVAVLAVDDADQNEALHLAQILRRNGDSIVLCPSQDSLSKKMKYCNKIDVDIAVIIGENEIQKQSATIKFFRNVGYFTAKTEKSVPFDALPAFIKDCPSCHDFI